MVFFHRIKKNDGFSLVELMIVVAIIGVLAALAVPRFQVFQAKARQSEAKSNLSHIYTLEEAYYGDQDSYAPARAYKTVGAHTTATGCACTTVAACSNPLGFSIAQCNPADPQASKVRYSYGWSLPNSQAFVAQAETGTGGNNRVLPACATADVWTMNQFKKLGHTGDSIASCL